MNDPRSCNQANSPQRASTQDDNAGGNAGGYTDVSRTEVHETVREETTFVYIPVERPPSFWDGIGQGIFALVALAIVGLLCILAAAGIASALRDEKDTIDSNAVSLERENAALKQKFDDYVGHCEDGTAAGGVDRLRVINDHNPGGPADPGLVYAGCITSENILGGRITSP